MLVRCEKCGTVIPDEALKCYKCGKERTPAPPYTIKPVVVDNPTSEPLRQKWKKVGANLATLALVLIVAAIVLLIIGFVADISLLIAVGMFCALVGIVVIPLLIYGYEQMLETQTKIVEENKRPYVDPEEYEKMIRDFVNGK